MLLRKTPTLTLAKVIERLGKSTSAVEQAGKKSSIILLCSITSLISWGVSVYLLFFTV
ncbi:MAG: hypothetical protein PVI26_02915 [Chitinispirillia bacterium]|jgi:hypothetical protein